MAERIKVLAWLAVAAEAGHLVAAWTEAPAWPLISGFHVVVAVCWGYLFAGLRKPEPRQRAYRFATVLAIGLPVLYLLSRLVGLPTYLSLTRLPWDVVGVGVTAVEVVLAVLLLTRRRWQRAAPASVEETEPEPASSPLTSS